MEPCARRPRSSKRLSHARAGWAAMTRCFTSDAHLSVAAHILRSDLGPVVQEVASRLLLHGAATLGEVIQGVSLPQVQVRNALLVLIQQNIVKCTARAIQGRRAAELPAAAMYEAVLDEVLVRRWFPRMLMHVRERPELGEDGELVLRELLACGRMPTEMLLERTTAAVAAASKLAVDDPKVDERRLGFGAALTQLQQQRYLVPSSQLPDELASHDAPPLPPLPAAVPAPSAATVSGASRKKPKLSGGGKVGGGAKADGRLMTAAAAAGSGNGAQIVGLVGGQPEGGAGAGTGAEGSSVLWRINTARFLTDFTHIAIQKFVGDKLDANAEGLVKELFRLQRSQAPALDDGPTYREPFTVDQLLARCPPKFGDGPPITGQVHARCANGCPRPLLFFARARHHMHRRVRAARHLAARVQLPRRHVLRPNLPNGLNAQRQVSARGARAAQLREAGPQRPLGAASWPSLHRTRRTPPSGTTTALPDARARGAPALSPQLLLESIVRSRFGDASCRLYRILLRRHAHGSCTSRGQQRYELKQLAELALLPERDARPLLWQLLQHAYVWMQEVPRQADRNPKTTTYLWHVSLPLAYRCVPVLLRRRDACGAAWPSDDSTRGAASLAARSRRRSFEPSPISTCAPSSSGPRAGYRAAQWTAARCSSASRPALRRPRRARSSGKRRP